MTDVAAPNERDPEIRGVPQPRLRDPLLRKAPVILKDVFLRTRVERSELRPLTAESARREPEGEIDPSLPCGGIDAELVDDERTQQMSFPLSPRDASDVQLEDG